MKTVFGLLVAAIGAYLFQIGFTLCDDETQKEFSAKFESMLKEKK